ADLLGQGERPLEVLLRLAGEAHDDVGGDGDPRAGGAEGGQSLEVRGDGVVALHPAQHGVAAALDREVEVRCDPLLDPERVDERVGEVVGVARGEPHPLDARDLGDAEQELGEGDAALVGVHVLADEGDLADAHPGERRDLLEHLDEGPAHLAAPGVRDDAEAADVVAALHHGDELAHLPRRAARVRAGEDVLLGVDPSGLGDADPVLDDAGDQLRQLADGVRAEDEVKVRDAREQLALLLLGDAAADGEEGAALGLDGPVAPEGREHLVLGLLADGAGVEDDEVRPVGRRRRPVADGGQRLAHAERVVDVHLAAEGVDEVALHGGPGTGPDTRDARGESMAGVRESPRQRADEPSRRRLRAPYSARSDTAGSTLAARIAGIQLASAAAPSSKAMAPTRVSGSLVLTPYTCEARARVPASAPVSPSATPSSAVRSPPPTTIRTRRRRSAPRAIRMPISRVRWATERATTL